MGDRDRSDGSGMPRNLHTSGEQALTFSFDSVTERAAVAAVRDPPLIL